MLIRAVPRVVARLVQSRRGYQVGHVRNRLGGGVESKFAGASQQRETVLTELRTLATRQAVTR
ncbi:hypothetical protein DIPPA_06980 [Diplonema papillatum]|nr:hypothetical protein DIPPA_06980 [Diplonema papillatum]